MNIKRGLSIIVSTFALLATSIQAKAADIKGYIHNKTGPASIHQVEFYKSGGDTFKTMTDTSGFYSCPIDSIDIDSLGDTITIKAKDSLGIKSGKTIYKIKGGQNYVPEFYVAEQGEPNFTPNIRWIKDTSATSAAIPFYGIFYSKKNPEKPCTAFVDTSVLSPHYDWFVNVSDSNLQHEDLAFISLEKRLGNGDTLLRTLIGFEIDSSTFNAMQILRNGNSGAQSIYFPLEIIVDSVGVEESSLKVKTSICPIPCYDMLNVKEKDKELELYDICGNFLGKRKAKNGRIDFSDLSSGIYFIKTEDKIEKLVKLKR